MVADIGLTKGQILGRDQVVTWFAQKYPKIKRGTVTAHLILLATNAPSRVHHNAKPADDLFYQIDSGRFRLYDAANDPAPIYPGEQPRVASAQGQAQESDEEGPPPTEFAYESDLRDFLAKNLYLVEPGLRLYQEEGITGLEFPAGGRFIDILALDAANRYVVIELKVSKGYDRVVGQLLRYMAWVEENHADPGQAVRGVIIAREISRDLVLACSRVEGVELYEYELSVELRAVGSRTANGRPATTEASVV
ncbi:MAG: endonuclease NucS domain-containing protein [Vicinamibacterales bacterium]